MTFENEEMDENALRRVARIFSPLRSRAGANFLVQEEHALTLTYDIVERRVEGVAAALCDLGLARGDRVAFLAEPSPDLVVSLLAVQRMGAIAVPVNTRYRQQEVRHVLEDSGAIALVHDRPAEVDRIAMASIVHRIALNDPLPGEHALEFLASKIARSTTPLPKDDDAALIIYTSGTTGPSKGAVLSYRALVDNILALTQLWRWTSDDRLVLALPLFHVHGLCIGLYGALLHGMSIILLRRFSPENVVKAFRKHEGTLFMGVPTMYARLIEHLEEHPGAARALRCARLFTAGSAALQADQLVRFEALTGHRILERYGMTETLITISNPYDGERRAGSVGLPVPGCEIKVLDEQGRDVGDDEPGELWVRSHGMMDHYWGRPDATRAVFRGGWFATGDVVTRDADGYVRIVGRNCIDIIKSGGFKIAAREIEDVLNRHPQVAEAAVVGLPDPVWGERIVAAVVSNDPDTDSPALSAALMAYVAESLADYKKPRSILVLESLPRNAMGKVEKVRLRACFGAA